MEALQLGVFAALLQIAGYTFYGSKILRRDILPNPTSWLMFAYGTSLIFVLEWDRDASLALLALPAACALSSIVVAVSTLRNTRSWWPEHLLDRFSFGFDVFLTVIYLSTWFLLVNGIIFEAQKDLADIIILVCWNIGIFTAFFPLLRQVYLHPQTEHAMPWIVWTSAYFMLTFATYVEVGGFSELMLYPLINLGVHAFIATHTATWRLRQGLSLI
ncbi:MAG: hypothetical protein HY422_02115 [Candidatus Komeilibacteria bacterium]|nr:hypothetical protein [Candidatus Komeilibacteria bacterium]